MTMSHQIKKKKKAQLVTEQLRHMQKRIVKVFFFFFLDSCENKEDLPFKQPVDGRSASSAPCCLSQDASNTQTEDTSD